LENLRNGRQECLRYVRRYGAKNNILSRSKYNNPACHLARFGLCSDEEYPVKCFDEQGLLCLKNAQYRTRHSQYLWPSLPNSTTLLAMEPTLEVTFAPVNFETLSARDLSRAVCAMFDILQTA